MALDRDRAVAWVRQGGFERVAVQFPDELLAGALELVSELQRSLPGCKVFILGDSTFGSSSVDEVGAEHFGADAIIHVGPSDQQHGCAVPVLFIFQTAPCAPPGAGALAAALRQEPPTSLVLLCDVSLQHAASELAAALKAQVPGLGDVLVAEPQLQAAGGSGSPARWRDWRFGALPLGSAWWASLGTATLAAAATPRPLRLCGREVRGAPGGAAAGLPDGCGVVLVAPPGGPLEGPLLLRHGCARPVWRLDPSGGGVERLCSTALLMQRYRLVELARAAGTFGLLVTPSYAAHVQAVADRLELLLRRSGRRVYRFVMGKVAAEKLGSYPAVECFVSLATSEHFPFVTKDLPVPIASPYELEVALGAREWTGDYVTDLDELLSHPLPRGPAAEDSLAVQTLGSRARVHHFSAGAAGGGGGRAGADWAGADPAAVGRVELYALRGGRAGPAAVGLPGVPHPHRHGWTPHAHRSCSGPAGAKDRRSLPPLTARVT